jgi:type I restriction enzyme S subunit
VSEWEQVRLGEVLALDIETVEVRPDEFYPIVGVLNRGRGLLRRDPVRGTGTRYRTLNVIRPGQVVYSRLKAFEGAITVTPETLHEGFASQEFPTFSCGPRLLSSYFRLITTTPRLWADLQNVSTGMGGRRERVKPADFLKIEMALPSKVEQKRIVDVVDSVDQQILALERQAEAADTLWWCLAAHMASDLADQPVVPLSEIADISGGLTRNKKDFDQPDLVEVPYLRVANVHRRYLDLRDVVSIKTTAAKAHALRLLPGDVLLNEGGDRDKLGRGAVWMGEIRDCIHQNHVFRARLKGDYFDPRFLSAWANSFGKAWFETHGTQTTGIASINKATLSRFPVPVVPRALQESWADRMDAVVVTQDRHTKEAAALRAFRSTLLTALLSQSISIPESYDTRFEAERALIGIPA